MYFIWLRNCWSIYIIRCLLILLFFVSLVSIILRLFVLNWCIRLRNRYRIRRNGNLKDFGIIIKIILMNIVCLRISQIRRKLLVIFIYRLKKKKKIRIKGNIQKRWSLFLGWELIFMIGKLRKFSKYSLFLSIQVHKTFKENVIFY